MANVIWNPGINSSNPTVELIVNQQSQSVDGNYSVLSWSLILHRPSTVSSSASKSYNVKINGVTVASGTTTIGGSGDKTIASGTTTVYHNADGTKTGVPFSFYMDIGISWSGTNTGNASGSGTINLTTIPRASSAALSASTINLGDSITVTITRASSSFTHLIYEDFFDGKWTKVTPSKVATSAVVTIPLSYASRIPNQVSGGGRILVETYNGDTYIGATILTFTANVPASVVPSVSISTSGVDQYQSQYVQGKSKVAVTLNEVGAYGSTIKSRSTTVKSGANIISTSSASPFTSGILTYSGTITIETTITDSRGRTATSSITITVVEYSPAKVVSFSAYRANSDGTPNPQGAYIKMVGTSLISAINNTNLKTTVLRYREKGTTTWTNGASSTTLYNPTLSAVVAADVNKQYEAQIYLFDYFGDAQSLVNIGTAFVMLDFRSTGKGVAFGKVSEMDALEIAIPAFLNGQPLATTDLAQMYKYVDDNGMPKDGGAELNSLITPGWYTFTSTTNNRPDSFGIVEVIKRTSVQIIQNAYSTGSRQFTRITVDGGTNWTAWKEFADTSQAIIESGSNANGRYIKFGDGTLTCWRSVTFSSTVNLAWGSFFYHATQNWTFPVAFVGDKPVCSAVCTDSGGELIGMVPTSTINNASFYGLRPTAITTAVSIGYRLFAIGRWKP